MKLAVTGALGHIGSAFIRSLTGRQYDEVLLLDNLMGERYSSLFDLPRDVPFRFGQADIRTADLESIFAGFDTVIHLAAITNAAESFGIADLVHDVNFNGTVRVAEACRNTGARMLFLSTTSVYGTQLEIVDENCPPSELKPQSPYASSKLSAEGHLIEMGAEGTRVRDGSIRHGVRQVDRHALPHGDQQVLLAGVGGAADFGVANGVAPAASVPPRRRRRSRDAPDSGLAQVRQRAL